MKSKSEKKNTPDDAALAARRKALLRWVAMICLPLLLLALITFAVRQSYVGFYRDNVAFCLQNIRIEGGSARMRESVEKLLRRNNITIGQTTLTSIEIGQLRRELILDPCVEEVAIRRIFPGELHITVQERVPVAELYFNRRYNHPNLKIDRHGIIVPNELESPRQNLPVILGLDDPKAFVPGAPNTHPGVAAFLTFQEYAQLTPDGIYFEVRRCRVDVEEDQMTLFLAARGPFREGSQVIIPLSNLQTQLERIFAVVRMRLDNNQTISYLNAKYERIPVRP